MGAEINFDQLEYEDLIRLGALAAEAMALSHEYDRLRARDFCELIAACNVEMLKRLQRARRRCGTSPGLSFQPAMQA
jgi:hypothetical protein